MKQLETLSHPYYQLFFLSFNKKIHKEFLDFLIENNLKDAKHILICINSAYGWNISKAINKRYSSSLTSEIPNILIEDIRKFMERKDQYQNLGIPFHRGYLLYGPPGNGKTSIAHIVASELNKSLYLLDLSLIKSDSELTSLFSASDNSIILVEDIDCYFHNRKISTKNNDNKFTFSGFINALDGIMSTSNIIFIATTNNIEKLDEALLRPGRIDKKFYISNATSKQAEDLFNKFYKNPILAKQFSNKVPDLIYNMATLQEYFIEYIDDPIKAIKNFSSEKLLELNKV